MRPSKETVLGISMDIEVLLSLLKSSLGVMEGMVPLNGTRGGGGGGTEDHRKARHSPALFLSFIVYI